MSSPAMRKERGELLVNMLRCLKAAQGAISMVSNLTLDEKRDGCGPQNEDRVYPDLQKARTQPLLG